MLEDEESRLEEQRKIEDNLEQPGNVIDNQDEPSGNTIENQEGVKVRERELKEKDDTMKKAREIRDNVGSSEIVKQGLGTM